MTVPLTASVNNQLDLLLEGVARSLQLTKTLYDDAESKYLAVADWLSKPDSPLATFNPTIYPQGSMSLQTTVKPRAQDEFDLDLVCLLEIDPSVGAAHLFQLVQERIAEQRKVQIDSRNPFPLHSSQLCRAVSLGHHPRLSKPGAVRETAILIPDRELQSLKNSNPKAYIGWFDGKCERKLSIYAKEGVEPLPENGGRKACLRLITQLTKRHRDVVYADDPASPASIALTTLLGNSYRGEGVCTDALLSALDEVAALIAGTQGILVISNPVDPSENLIRKWTPLTYRRFREFVLNFRERMRHLLTLQGMQAVQAELEALFGEAPARASIQELAKKVNDDRSSGRLHVAGPAATLASSGKVKVRPNTFHGN